ncbi:MAG: hypothetical protein R3Y43_07060 [Alphaproteobacteria bacterium]
MKNVFSLFIFCFLISCVLPQYHSQSQKLLLSDYIDVSSKTLTQVRQTEILIDEKPINPKDIVYEKGVYVLKVDRSRKDKTIVIKDEYGDSQTLHLQSFATDELWAKTTGFEGKDVSAAYLFAPTNTIVNFKENSLTKAIIFSPFSLVFDVINIVILGPSTAIINPWFEYTER